MGYLNAKLEFIVDFLDFEREYVGCISEISDYSFWNASKTKDTGLCKITGQSNIS